MNVIPNFTIVLQWINFAILLFLLTKFLYKPLIKLLDDRRDKVKSTIDSAARTKEEADEIFRERRTQLDQVDREAKEIKLQAAKDGLKEREKIVDRAKEDATRIVERARDDILLQEKKARQRLREEAVDLSISVAEKLLEKEIDQADQRRFVGRAIEEMEESGG